jgi:hypothetical protein
MISSLSKIFETRGGLYISHHKNHREGPKIYFVVRKGRECQMFTDATALLKWIKWPKSEPTGAALREWLDEWNQQDNPVESAPVGFEPTTDRLEGGCSNPLS